MKNITKKEYSETPIGRTLMGPQKVFLRDRWPDKRNSPSLIETENILFLCFS